MKNFYAYWIHYQSHCRSCGRETAGKIAEPTNLPIERMLEMEEIKEKGLLDFAICTECGIRIPLLHIEKALMNTHAAIPFREELIQALTEAYEDLKKDNSKPKVIGSIHNASEDALFYLVALDLDEEYVIGFWDYADGPEGYGAQTLDSVTRFGLGSFLPEPFLLKPYIESGLTIPC